MAKKTLSGSLYRDLVEMQEKMHRLVESTLNPQMETSSVFGQDPFTPKCDIYETEEAFILELELPGVNPEAVDVTVDGNYLRVAGERSLDGAKGEGYLQMERSSGPFVRLFELPKGIESEGVEASYQLGILAIRLTKKINHGQKIKVKRG